nr:tetratricopeptide repeat protein [Nakamurella aerolata]
MWPGWFDQHRASGPNPSAGAPADAGESVIQRASMLDDAGRPAEAIAVLAPYLAEHPDDPRALLVLGWAQLHADDGFGAADTSHRLLARAPDALNPMLLAATVFAHNRDHRAAAAVADRAIALAPHAAVAYRVRAQVDLATGVTGPATRAFADQAVRLDPQSSAALLTAGTAALEARDRAAARNLLERAAAMDPDNLAVRNELARLDMGRGGSLRAAGDFASIVRDDPTQRVALHNLRVAVWKAFGTAHLVLWAAMFVVGRIHWLAGNDGGRDGRPGWLPILAAVAVLATGAAWAIQLQRAGNGLTAGLAAGRTVLASDRLLQIGFPAHVGCLLALLLSALLPGNAGQVAFFVALALLVLASITTWIAGRRWPAAAARWADQPPDGACLRGQPVPDRCRPLISAGR